MNKLALAMAGVFGALMTGGCATNEPNKPLAEVKPLLRASGGQISPDAYYQLGRYYQGQNRLDQAADAFRKALVVDPAYAEARNALGVILAAQGKLDDAVAAFQAAAQVAPRAPHILSNLGYAYYLQGRVEMAIDQLEHATALDNADDRAWTNLSLALEKAGQPEHAKLALLKAAEVKANAMAAVQAATPAPAATPATEMATQSPQGSGASPEAVAQAPVAVGDPRSPVALVPSSGQPAPIQVIGARMETTERDIQPVPPTPLVQASPGVFELATVPAATMPQPVQAVAIAALPAPEAAPPAAPKTADAAMPPYRLEVSNGNGVTGMAKRVSLELMDRGLPHARLTNRKPFQQHQTKIEYRAGFAEQAGRLSATFAQRPPLVQVAGMNVRTDVRLVLGHDLPRNFALAEPAGRGYRLASAQ